MRFLALLLLIPLAAAQRPLPPAEKPEVQLPSGKNQKQEILKADYEKTRAEAVELAEMTVELREAIERSEHQVLDLRTVKKAEEIEKLAKRIKDRLKRYY